MFGFLKKNKKSNTDDSNSVIPIEKKRKNKNSVFSVLDESVVEKIVEYSKTNTAFRTTFNDKPATFGMCLNLADIGGLSQKEKKDESKGQIIEKINGGDISCLCIPELMDQDKIVILPDVNTISNMEEFMILAEAPYKQAFIFDDGTYEITDGDVSFDIIYDLIESDGKIDDILYSEDEMEDEINVNDVNLDSVTEIDDEVEIDESDNIHNFEEDGYEDDFDADDFDDGSNDDEISDDAFEDSDEDDAYSENDEVDDDEMHNDESEDDYGEVIIEREELVSKLNRIINADNFNFSYDLNNFNFKFQNLVLGDFDRFDTSSADSWIEEQVKLVSTQANNSLKSLRLNHFKILQNAFITCMDSKLNDMQQKYDISNPDTLYGGLLSKVEAIKRDRELNLDNVVLEKETELQEEYNKKREEYVNNQAKDAEIRYDGLNLTAHKLRIDNIRQNEKSKINGSYDTSKIEILKERSDKMKSDFAIFESQILNNLSESWEKMRKQELEEENKFEMDIRKLIDENRKYDIAKIENDTKQLELDNSIAKLTEEYQTRIQQIENDFTTQLKLKEEYVKTILEREENALRNQDDNFNRILSERDKIQFDLKSDYDKLLNNYIDLEKTKDEKVLSEIERANNEANRWLKELEIQQQLNKRFSLQTVSIIIVIALLALFVGGFIGMKYGFDIRDGIKTNVSQTIFLKLSSIFGKFL